MTADNCCPPPEKTASCCAPPRQADPCCQPAAETAACCGTQSDNRPGYKLWPFVIGWLDTPAGPVPQVATRLTSTDIRGRWQMRWGIGRDRFSIAAGLYAIGTPASSSPVLVTANYKMTFDILRRDMDGHDAWLLVLDTKGINVWCAAGKGTFGTAELVRQVQATHLANVVDHRTLLLPQLGAPGVSAHQVARGCGFKVEYGPVRSSDLPRFLANGRQATPEMRRVRFDCSDRLVLTPVELVNMRRQIFWGALALFVIGGVGPGIFSLAAAWSRGGAAVATGLLGVFTGAVAVPVLLPWLPFRAFAAKGALAGLVSGALAILFYRGGLDWLNALALLLAVTAISSWCSMHFTGSTTFTSPSGVEKEMRHAIPGQATALLAAGVCWLAGAF